MKKYSKLILNVCLAIGLVIAFVSCSSGPTVYDKSIPPEQSSVLRITVCAITKFDGINMGAKWNALAGIKQVQIPSGQHSIQVYQSGGGFGYSTQNTVDVTYNFLPGRTYIVFLGTVNQGAKLQIVDVTRTDEEPKIDPSSPDATKFEGIWVNTQDEMHQLIFFNNEFAMKAKGQYSMRGPFSYDDKNLALTIVFTYKKEKWDMLAAPLGPARATYSDNIITMGKTQFKKVD
jgi:hypothetical protein